MGEAMNKFTEALWEGLNVALDDDEELLADLKKLLFKEYTPFLTPEQALQVNIHALQTYVQDLLNKWYAWLPDTTSNQLGGELALAALQEVYWSVLAGLLQERLASSVKGGNHARR
jgi:hypothetical protein